jgi:osmoprotectant transport system substrate-binding protein
MWRAYDFELPSDNIVELEEDRIYEAIDEGDRCNFGEVFITDGRIDALDLTVLEDDERFFLVYNPSLNVREEVIGEYSGTVDLFAPMSAKLDSETLRELNATVEMGGGSEKEGARQFLRRTVSSKVDRTAGNGTGHRAQSAKLVYRAWPA